MSEKRYPETFKIAAVKQVPEANFGAYEVADKLGTTTNSHRTGPKNMARSRAIIERSRKSQMRFVD